MVRRATHGFGPEKAAPYPAAIEFTNELAATLAQVIPVFIAAGLMAALVHARGTHAAHIPMS